MDQSHPDADAAHARPRMHMLLMAACVPFAVIGLLASPIAFNALWQLVGA